MNRGIPGLDLPRGTPEVVILVADAKEAQPLGKKMGADKRADSQAIQHSSINTLDD